VRQFRAQRVHATGGITWAAIGDGFALPHLSARVALGRDAGTVALLLLREPLTQAGPAPDNVPVTRMFFFIAPSPRAHLDLIGRLTRALSKGALREAVTKGASDAEMFAAAAAADAGMANGKSAEVKR
jgi:PTS system nitrogen regulatory IIA component